MVTFARSAAEDCSQVYTVLKAVGADPFQAYLEEVLQPRFWVGTDFFVRVTMLYGVDVQVHFLNGDREPQLKSTLQLSSLTSMEIQQYPSKILKGKPKRMKVH